MGRLGPTSRETRRKHPLDLVVLQTGEAWGFEAKWWLANDNKTRSAISRDGSKLDEWVTPEKQRRFHLLFWWTSDPPGDDGALGSLAETLAVTPIYRAAFQTAGPASEWRTFVVDVLERPAT